MITLASEVADELRAHVSDLLERQAAAHQQHSMANVVLAGLTLVWLDEVHSAWNSMPGESAMSVLRHVGTKDKREYKLAARDFLRRSGWWIKRRKR